MKGRWKYHFKNDNPVILELACGKGEYTVGLAKIYPSKNYIGVDIKGNRLWAGAKKSIDEGIPNAAFLRTQIDKIHTYFDAGEVEEIWIPFPDPQLRASKARKRLTHPKFLRLYKQFLQQGGRIHLKTDSPELYFFTRKVIEHYKLTTISDIPDLNVHADLPPQLKISTYYEGLDIARSNKVSYLCFTLPGVFPEGDDLFNELIKCEEFKNQ